MIVRRHHLLLIASLPLATCLPEDARPEPGVAIASASADPGLASGFITADGWSVTFTTFLLTVGELDLGGDDCTPYAESDYLRLLDLRQPGPQRLALLHGLGDCDIAFEVRPPTADTVLGAGVDAMTKAAMRTAATDPFIRERGVAARIAGSATLGDRTQHFDWSLRTSLEYPDCGRLAFSPGAESTLNVLVHGAALFQVGGADAVAFEPYAAADANGDSMVTLEELSTAPATDPAFESLGEQLYFGRFPRLVRLDGSEPCPSRVADD